MFLTCLDFLAIRDLMPSNLFRSDRKNSDEPCLKVLDFGLARLAPASETAQATLAFPAADDETAMSQITGTPPYMAPEMLRGCSANPASDRFAFGVVAYELLTGSLPFGSDIWKVR